MESLVLVLISVLRRLEYNTTLDSADLSAGAVLPSHMKLSAKRVRLAVAAAAARKNAGFIQVALSLPGENDRGGSFPLPSNNPNTA